MWDVLGEQRKASFVHLVTLTLPKSFKLEGEQAEAHPANSSGVHMGRCDQHGVFGLLIPHVCPKASASSAAAWCHVDRARPALRHSAQQFCGEDGKREAGEGVRQKLLEAARLHSSSIHSQLSPQALPGFVGFVAEGRL